METTTYFLFRYQDGQEIGTAVLTAEQFANCMAMAQQPEGIIRLGALPHEYYELSDDYRGLHEDITVFLV